MQILSLDHTTPILSLLFLFWANLICRCVAIAIMSIRESLRYELVHTDEDKMIREEESGKRMHINIMSPELSTQSQLNYE